MPLIYSLAAKISIILEEEIKVVIVVDIIIKKSLKESMEVEGVAVLLLVVLAMKGNMDIITKEANIIIKAGPVKQVIVQINNNIGLEVKVLAMVLVLAIKIKLKDKRKIN